MHDEYDENTGIGIHGDKTDTHMPTQKHTPGPWEIRTYDHLKSFELRSPKHSWPIAYIRKLAGRGPDSIPKTSQQANAHLISAAPELLEALSTILKFLESDAWNPRPSIILAKKAISKAEGKTP